MTIPRLPLPRKQRTPGIRIRPAQSSDAPGVSVLFAELVAYLRSVGDATEYRFGVQTYLDDGFGPNAAFRGFVAENESGLVGYTLFSRAYDGDYVRSLYIIDLYVHRAHRRKGVGWMLMDAVRETARNEGISRVSWSVHKKNSEALRFYANLGGKIANEIHSMYLEVL